MSAQHRRYLSGGQRRECRSRYARKPRAPDACEELHGDDSDECSYGAHYAVASAAILVGGWLLLERAPKLEKRAKALRATALLHLDRDSGRLAVGAPPVELVRTPRRGITGAQVRLLSASF